MKGQNIIEQFEKAVSEYPENIAVISGDLRLTYKELNNRANTLARLIRNTATGNCKNVTLLLDHNEEIISGILGVLKAGKTYIPIDSQFPLDRCKLILNNSESNILITNGTQLSLAYKLLNSAERDVSIINISDLTDETHANPGLHVESDQPAYVLYTSGSTGEPKGVVQSHHTVVSFMNSYIAHLDIKETDNVLLTTPYSHTVSVIDIFSMLFAGGTISVVNLKQDFNVREMFGLLNMLNVSIVHVVPTFFRYFTKYVTDKSMLEQIRLVVLGGEEVLDKDVELYKENFSDDCLFINLYGSSEVILATLNILNKDSGNDRKVVPVGYPFDEVKTLVLDENLEETDVHGIGELYVGADFLNPKYYNDPNGTNALYLKGDNEKDIPFVKMGDLVKLLPDGNIQLVGRKDNQIKINGNRVHINEIEVVLNNDDSIEQNVVVPIKNENNDISLIAYIKTPEEKPNLEKIKEGLRQKLPAYMIPSFFVKIENIPTTPNGKVDRKGLPKISFDELVSNKEVSEKTELQKVILKIWQSALENEDITIHDNFFQLGGNSLVATEMVNKIFLELDVEVELSAIFDHQTVYEMAKYLDDDKIQKVVG